MQGEEDIKASIRCSCSFCFPASSTEVGFCLEKRMIEKCEQSKINSLPPKIGILKCKQTFSVFQNLGIQLLIGELILDKSGISHGRVSLGLDPMAKHGGGHEKNDCQPINSAQMSTLAKWRIFLPLILPQHDEFWLQLCISLLRCTYLPSFMVAMHPVILYIGYEKCFS